MSKIIAVAGKGGTGKTTVSALVVKYLLENKKTPVLCVDADPNSNMHIALGVNFSKSIGDILDEFQKTISNIPPGITKESYIEGKISEILVEENGFDLLVMGKGEGPGCYCYVNNLLRDFMERIYKNYKYVVVDNEAGMEHLSRKTNRYLDMLFLVSDPTIKGIRTCKNLHDLIKKLEIKVKNIYLVINRIVKELPASLEDEVKKQNLNLVCTIPEDNNIKNCDIEGTPVLHISDESPSYIEIKKLMEKVLLF